MTLILLYLCIFKSFATDTPTFVPKRTSVRANESDATMLHDPNDETIKTTVDIDQQTSNEESKAAGKVSFDNHPTC